MKTTWNIIIFSLLVSIVIPISDDIIQYIFFNQEMISLVSLFSANKNQTLNFLLINSISVFLTLSIFLSVVLKNKNLFNRLIKSNIKFNIIFNSSSIPSALLSAKDGKINDANETFCEMFGVKKGEIIGIKPADLGLNFDSDDGFDLVGEVKTKRKIINIERTYINQSGREIHTLISLNIIGIDHDEYVLIMINDITDRVIAERNFINTKNIFQAAIENMSDAFFISDTEGNIVHFNEAFVYFYKFKNKNECPKNINKYTEILDVYLETGEIATFEQWTAERAFKGEKATDEVYKLRRKDTGEEWTGSYNFAPIKENGKRIIGIVVTARDITEKVKSSEALTESQKLFSTIFNKSSLIIGLADITEGRLVQVNEAFTRCFGFTKDEVIGKTSLELGINPNEKIRKDLFSDLSKGNVVQDLAIPLFTKNGELRYFKNNIDIIEINKQNFILSSLLDITENISIHKELAKSEKMYRQLIENLQEGIWQIDENAFTTFVNIPMAEMLEYTIDEMIGKNLLDFMYPQDMELAQFYLERRRSGIQESHLFEFRTKTGRKIIVTLTTSPLYDDKQHYIGAIAGIIEITELKKNEHNLNKMNRLYAVLSNCNQLIVREKNVNTIFERICEIIVNDGEFKMAWVGVKENNQLNIVSKYGQFQNYIQVLELDLTNAINEQCLTATAILTSKIVIWNDIENDIAFIRYRKEALYNGFKSCISLPIYLSGEVIAAISIYSDQVNYFDHKEINMLAELAGDISFALENIQNEKQKYEVLEQLSLSELKYRNLFENSAVGFYQSSIDGKLLIANQTLADMLGYSSFDELSGINIVTDGYANETGRSEFLNLFSDDSNVVTYESKWKRKNGTELNIKETAKAIRNEKREIIKFEGIVEDISKQKEIEKTASFNANMFRSVVEAANDGMIIVGSDQRVILWNNKFSEMTGYRPEQIYNLDIKKILPEEHIRSYFTKLYFEDNNINKNVETYGVTSSGNIIPLSVSFSYWENENQDYYGAFLWDISDDKIIKEKLILAKEKAEEMNRLKSSFLANMSHELRTPMNGILSFSNLITLTDDIEEIREMSGYVYLSGKRLMQTLNLILDLSVIEAGATKLDIENIEMVSILNDGKTLFEPLAIEKGLKINYFSNFEFLNILSDAKAIHSIFDNLIGNAVKFTNKGEITISLDILEQMNKQFVEVKISDTGIGIASENIPVIFGEFRQVSEGFNRSHEGTGLGLTITKKFVDILGGFISVESKLDQGSVFTVLIPLIPADKHTNEIIPKMESKFKKDYSNFFDANLDKTILVVEDDSFNIALVKRLLKYLVHIDTAVNSAEALQKVSEKQYDAVLMDINLGRSKNGLETTKEIRKMPNYASIPIVAMTAYAMKGDKEEFLASGCSHYISKPFDKDEFCELVNEVLLPRN